MANYKYLIEQDQDYKWGVVVTTIGQQVIPAGAVYPSIDHPRRYLFSKEKGRILDEYQIVYITKGQGWFMSKHMKKTSVTAGDVFFLFPGEWHNYAPDPATGWEESWIGFKGTYAENLLKEGFLSPDKPLLIIGILDCVWNLFNRACSVARDQRIAFQQELSGIAINLLGTVYASEKQYGLKGSEVIDQLEESKKYMFEHVSDNPQMEEISEVISMGYSRFRRLFKDYTGLSPASYFAELKISRGKELLTNTEMTCQEIAYSLGFQSSSYFNTAFFKRAGMTPMQYRKLTRRNIV